MLAFRKGRWITVDVATLYLDPLFTETLRKRIAANAATQIARGVNENEAIAAAEADLYRDLLRVSGEQHDAPKH